MNPMRIAAATVLCLALAGCGHASPTPTEKNLGATDGDTGQADPQISREEAITQCQDIAGQQGLGSIIPESMWVSKAKAKKDNSDVWWVHGHYPDSSGSSTTGYWSFGCVITLTGKPLSFGTTFGNTNL